MICHCGLNNWLCPGTLDLNYFCLFSLHFWFFFAADREIILTHRWDMTCNKGSSSLDFNSANAVWRASFCILPCALSLAAIIKAVLCLRYCRPERDPGQLWGNCRYPTGRMSEIQSTNLIFLKSCLQFSSSNVGQGAQISWQKISFVKIN